MLTEKWIDTIISVKQNDHHCLELHFLVGTVILNAISCHVPQYGLSADVKYIFYVQGFSLVTAVPEKKMLLLGKDLNGHVAEHNVGFEDIRGVHGYGFKATLQLPAFSCTGIPAGKLHSR